MSTLSARIDRADRLPVSPAPIAPRPVWRIRPLFDETELAALAKSRRNAFAPQPTTKEAVAP